MALLVEMKVKMCVEVNGNAWMEGGVEVEDVRIDQNEAVQ